MNTTLLNVTSNYMQTFGRFQFVSETPAVAIPCLVMLALSSVFGTFGNILILVAIFSVKSLRRLECVFIANLAMSDLYITAVGIPFSIVAKIEGEEFFNRIAGLCRTIASICTVSCVSSLGTIAILSFNRYVFICHNKYYNKIFKKLTCTAFCVSLYVIGIGLVLVNFAGIGSHAFDRKSLECIWDRMVTYVYTVVVSVAFVWIPVIVVGFSYLLIYLSVKRSQNTVKLSRSGSKSSPSASLARSFFIIYAVFTVCWVPYAMLAVIDTDDNIAHEIHLYITVWAHMHPSFNWLIYYLTNNKFEAAFNQLVHLDVFLKKCKKDNEKDSSLEGGITSDTLLNKSKTSNQQMDQF